MVFLTSKNCGSGEEGAERDAGRGTRAMRCLPAAPWITEMVSKMMKVVALGLVAGSQGRALATALPHLGAAAALALVLLQVYACNPRCWQGWLCRGAPRSPLCQTPAASTGWGLGVLGGFTTCSLLFTGALFALARAGER